MGRGGTNLLWSSGITCRVVCGPRWIEDRSQRNLEEVKSYCVPGCWYQQRRHCVLAPSVVTGGAGGDALHITRVLMRGMMFTRVRMRCTCITRLV